MQLERGFHSSYLMTLPVTMLTWYIMTLLMIKLTKYQSIVSLLKSYLTDSHKFAIKNQDSKVSLTDLSYLPITLHYILLVIFWALFANLEILPRIVSTHPVYHWAYVYLMAKPGKNWFEKTLKMILILYHFGTMVFEMSVFPLNVGTP